MGYEQPNASLTGPGINPWNQNAWSGGSSSGSGSAVGAGCVPFAIGSETWGSITTPASYCGVSGLRPTYGRVSRHGAMALCWTLDKLGPLARTADDCGLVLGALAGPDPRDPTTIPTPFSYAASAPERPRLGVLRDGLDAVQPEVRANFLASLETLASQAILEDATLPDLPYADATTIILQVEAAAAMEDLLDRNLLNELTAPEDRVGGYAGQRDPGSRLPARPPRPPPRPRRARRGLPPLRRSGLPDDRRRREPAGPALRRLRRQPPLVAHRRGRQPGRSPRGQRAQRLRRARPPHRPPIRRSSRLGKPPTRPWQGLPGKDGLASEEAGDLDLSGCASTKG